MSAPVNAPADPLANKALASGIGTIVLVLLRWAVSGEFQLSDEGLITLAGAITTTAVYSVSNFRSSWGRHVTDRKFSEDGHTLVELLVALVLLALLVVVVLALVGDADAAVDVARSSWGRHA